MTWLVPDRREVDDRAPRLDGSHAGERELLQVLVGAAEVGVVRLEHEHLGALIRAVPDDVVVDHVEADRESDTDPVHVEDGLAVPACTRVR